ncbi:unnamed protein product [Closterium sp. NIES-64]|nr:unnamed protein product [Closterium sp. NIES-64]
MDTNLIEPTDCHPALVLRPSPSISLCSSLVVNPKLNGTLPACWANIISLGTMSVPHSPHCIRGLSPSRPFPCLQLTTSAARKSPCSRTRDNRRAGCLEGPGAAGDSCAADVLRNGGRGSQAPCQAVAMEEWTERQADGSVGAVKDLEDQEVAEEVPVRLVSYEMVDAGSLADRQAAAMEQEEAERQEGERAAMLKQPDWRSRRFWCG